MICMPVARVNDNLLREYVTMLLEAGDEPVWARLDAEERSAKQAYDDAINDLNVWRKEVAKRDAFVNRARELGLSPSGESARKKLKSDPRYAYDPKIVQKQERTLLAQLEKAKDLWGAYDPSVTGYKRAAPTTQSSQQVALPQKGKKVYATPSDIKPMRWYDWNDPRWAKAIAGIPYGSRGSGSDSSAGIGPGEARLAKIFGGEIQGGGVSFDIVTPDGRQWEVKALEGATDTIRPESEGRAAFAIPKARMDRIIKQIRMFGNVVKKLELSDDVGPDTKKVLDYIEHFVNADGDMIIKGELSKERIIALRSALRALSAVKKTWESEGQTEVDTTIGISGKDVELDKPTFVDVAKKVDAAVPDAGVLSGFDERDLALSCLVDPCFSDPRSFFDEWFESVDIDRIFEQVDGVFIVNQSGFNKVPKGLFKKAFKFVSVTQGKPRFEYVYYNG